jgi:PAS domain S-box-containing protein
MGSANRPNDLGELRRRAEAAWRERGSDANKLSTDDVSSLVRELEVHQIELEMQNEELRRAQEKLEAARDKYADLYDFAPAGHLTINENTLILEANLTAATLLGTERGVLLGQSLSRFISPEDQGVYYQHRRAVLAAKERQTSEVRMVPQGGTPFDSRMQSVGIPDHDGSVSKWRTVISDITEHKRAEQALRESEKRLNRTQEIAHLGSWELDVVNDRLIWSDEVYRIFGLKPQQFGATYEAFLDRVHPDDRTAVDAAYTDSLRGNRDTYEVEHRIIRKDSGEVRFVHEKCEHSRDTTGRIIRSIGMVLDITERKQVEEALRRQRDFADSLIETAQAIVLVLDPAGRIVRFNPFMEQVSGYPLEVVRGQDWFTTFLPASDRSRIREVFSRAVSDIQTRGNINPIMTRDGRARYIAWSDKTLKDADGNVVGLLSIGHDITESRQAEAALREREQELGLILASTDEGIYGMNPAGRFTFANRASVRMLGYRDEQALLGKDVHALIHHTCADGTPHTKEDCPIYQARCENKVVHLDDELLWRADGSSFRVDYRSHPMVRDGEVVGTVVSFTDITERKEKEAQLLQAQKMEVVGQLTGGIAHDFNNLLTVILANLGLLGDEIASDTGASTRELIHDALSAARDGAALTQRLLAFSRKQSLQVQRVDIGEFLRNIRRFLQRILREDIELSIPRAKEAPPVFVDPRQFESALLNLVVNARDAMPKGGTLIIETTRKCVGGDVATADPELAPGNYVMITVRDSGIGMSPEDAARAIEPFFTTKQRGKGSGLGLSMVYGFARQSGGGLLLMSVLGEGTTVSMLLPEVAPAMEKEDAEPTPRNAPGGSERILLVEDELQIRNVTKRIFSGLGYEVIAVENAAAAMKVFEAEASVDLLFSDVIMPGDMNGRELAVWALQKHCGLKVLLTTGFSEEEAGERSADTGRVHLLRKPYMKEELAAAVRAVLDGGTVRNLPQ